MFPKVKLYKYKTLTFQTLRSNRVRRRPDYFVTRRAIFSVRLKGYLQRNHYLCSA